MMFYLIRIGIGWSAPRTDGEQVLARHADAEPGGETVVWTQRRGQW